MTSQILVRSVGARSRAAEEIVHLYGAIATPDRFIRDGTIVLRGDRIALILDQRLPAAEKALAVDTGCLLCPGFVDTHNHAAYAAFCRWKKPSKYLRGRFDWRGKTRSKVVVVPEPDPYYTQNVANPFREIRAVEGAMAALTLYGQVRGVVGGATTMVIDADLDPREPLPLPGFTRDPSDWPGRVWGILDVGCIDDAQAATLAAELESDKAKLLVHVGEGVDEFSRGEFLSLVLRGLLTRNTVLIHGLALLDSDWQLVKASGASVIWSPVSNFRLYGRSVDIGQLVGAGIPIALAPDWTVTGSSTVLDELRFVRARYGWLGDELLLSMVTDVAADIIGMPTLGRIAPGCFADIIAFSAEAVMDRATAAARIVQSSHEDVQLVLVGGRAIYGSEDMIKAFPANGESEERIEVPLPTGITARRVLRIGDDAPFEKAFALLSGQFQKYAIPVAPLWEAD